MKLSVCIITKNEEDRIGRCLKAVADLADEIIVVDSGSTDSTVKIAESLGAKVSHNPWSGYGPQKRRTEELAKNDWILNLDADEVVTPELKEEIRALLKTTPRFVAYRMRIRTVYPGKSKPRLWADVYNQVRLYDHSRVRFKNSPIHDSVDTKTEKVGQLKGSVIHFAARSFAHIRKKLDSYASLQAQTYQKSRYVIILRLPFEYPLVFIKYFIFQRHFTGGWRGIMSSHLAAESRFKRLLKMWK